MNEWKEIVSCAIANPVVNGTKFQSVGDWSMILHQKQKEGMTRFAALQLINKEYELGEEEEGYELKQNGGIKTLKQALSDCSIQIIENEENWMEGNDVREGVYYGNIVNDGNTTISLFEDEKYYYSIFFETS